MAGSSDASCGRRSFAPENAAQADYLEYGLDTPKKKTCNW